MSKENGLELVVIHYLLQTNIRWDIIITAYAL